MQRLWAPWRMEYILNDEKNDECFFCRIFSAKEDRNNHVVFRNDKSFAVMNKYPYNNGHLLVAPSRHIATLEELPEEDLLDMMMSVQQCIVLLRKTIMPHGFNVGVNTGLVAGAGVPDHVHFHIVPRWDGDSNYMPVIANTKIIPQALDSLYDDLINGADIKK
ncbi:MAG: HIT domain-containing protein [Candidatus Theseobacter exili]|nr:HIT domain-containing protein [Candidatus Theseobacter exili]